jgi:hypothetical protein
MGNQQDKAPAHGSDRLPTIFSALDPVLLEKRQGSRKTAAAISKLTRWRRLFEAALSSSQINRKATIVTPDM